MSDGAPKGGGMYKRRPASILEATHEATTVVSITREHGSFIVYVVREGDIDVWSEMIGMSEGDAIKRACSYRHEVIADYLASKQRPDLHGHLSQTKSALRIVEDYEAGRRHQ